MPKTLNGISTVKAERLEVNEIVIRPSTSNLTWDSKQKHKLITLTNSTVAKTKGDVKGHCGIVVNKELNSGLSKYKWYYESKGSGDIIFGLSENGHDLSSPDSYIAKKISVECDDVVSLHMNEKTLQMSHTVSSGAKRMYKFKIDDVGILFPYVCSVPGNGFHLKISADINSVITSDINGTFNITADVIKADSNDISRVNLLKIGDNDHPGINTNTLNAVIRMSIDDTKESNDKLWSSSKTMDSIRSVNRTDDLDKHLSDKKIHVSIDDENLARSSTWSSVKIKESLEKQDVSKRVLDHLKSKHCKADDHNLSNDNTWSSNKISAELIKVNNVSKLNQHLGDDKIHNPLDDNKVSTFSVWSSKKITDILGDQSSVNDHINDSSVHFKINDVATPSDSHVWSAIKTSNAINACNNVKKLDEHIHNKQAHPTIQDQTKSNTSLWSSNKIADELNNMDTRNTLALHENNRNIHVPVDDSITSNNNIWTSKKTNDTIENTVSFIVDDAKMGGNTTWSSVKINTAIDESSSSLILDNRKGKNILWSSEKIAEAIQQHDSRSQLDTHVNDIHLHPKISDNAVEPTTMWSSEKTKSEINKITSTILEDQKTVNIDVFNKINDLTTKIIDPTKHVDFSSLSVSSIKSSQKVFNDSDLITKEHLNAFIYNYKIGNNIPKGLYVSGVYQDTNPSCYVQMSSGDVTYASPVYTKDPFTLLDNNNIANLTILKSLMYNVDTLPDQTAGFGVTASGIYKVNVGISVLGDNNTSKISLILLKNDKPMDVGAMVSGIEEKNVRLDVNAIVSLKPKDTIKVALKTQYLDSIINFSYLNISAERMLVNV